MVPMKWKDEPMRIFVAMVFITSEDVHESSPLTYGPQYVTVQGVTGVHLLYHSVYKDHY